MGEKQGWSGSTMALAVAAALLGTATPGWTAGGAHFVEDAEVLEPGLCQVDLWVTRFEPGAGYANATPTCTLKSLPRLEWGLQYQHYWYNDTETTDPLLGPTAKLNLIPEDTGVGLGLYFNSGVNVRTGELELVTLLVPLTIPLDDRVRFNFNAGWSYVKVAAVSRRFLLGRPGRSQSRGGGVPDAGDVRSSAGHHRRPDGTALAPQ